MRRRFSNRKTLPRARPRCAGVTLLEMLISMTLAITLLTSLFALYYGAARGAARDEARGAANQESRMVVQRLAREFKLVGLLAPQDVNGDANDINRDVPNESWSDSIRSDFEFANTYDLVCTGDYDNDGRTETIRYRRNAGHNTVEQTVWEWSRDSLRWLPPVMKTVATHVDHMMFLYWDRDGNSIPASGYPYGSGYTLTTGERSRVTAVEIMVVTRSDRQENAHPEFLYLPDGTYWYDGYHRTVHRFLVRGRNLSLGA
ncbi:type II secretion system GspH family protein [bacterium]|nr:type II secretion system GspH family protein [bacterium]MBU1985398.1 type II secretion system GspH family protein [bacterium]